MKWLIILFSIIKPFFSGGTNEMPNPVAEIKEMIRVNAVKVLLSFAAFSAMATIFAAGIILIAVDISTQYDVAQYVQFSATTLAGIILILLPVIAGAIMVKKYHQPAEVKKREVLTNVGAEHPLQDALALLVHDFVKEREMRRAQDESAPRPDHHPEPHHSPRPSKDEKIPKPDDYRH
ncbi:MAG: hypothetical protein H7177_14855 [Rhizobacter sp.]|nr:hypothetical protein [Bacteriovorax sp.]